MQNWEKNLLRKHEEQIADHERQFGKLGELQNKTQKQALKRANVKLAEEKAS